MNISDHHVPLLRHVLGQVIHETEQRRSALFRQTEVLHDQVDSLKREGWRLTDVVSQLKDIDAELAGEDWLG